MRSFNSLSEREILALAISLEEEDERVHADYAERYRRPRSSANVSPKMRGCICAAAMIASSALD